MIITEVGVMYVLCDKMFIQFEVVNATLLQYRYKRLYLAKINSYENFESITSNYSRRWPLFL